MSQPCNACNGAGCQACDNTGIMSNIFNHTEGSGMNDQRENADIPQQFTVQFGLDGMSVKSFDASGQTVTIPAPDFFVMLSLFEIPVVFEISDTRNPGAIFDTAPMLFERKKD